MFVKTTSKLDRDCLGLLVGVWIAKDGFQQLCVQNQRIEIVANRIDVNILMNQCDDLDSKAMPE